MSSSKKLELQTFLDLKRDSQIKVAMYLIGALVLIMVGASSLAAIKTADGSFSPVSIVMGIGGLVGGYLLGDAGYKILIDPKNAKTCNANFWSVTENIGFDEGSLKSDLGTTLCKAQTKAEYDGYAGFYCVSNTETEDTVDVYYIELPESKKLTLTKSGTSNVFTIKSGDNKITVTEPSGSFTLTTYDATETSVSIRGSNFNRINETVNVTVNVREPGSPAGSPSSPSGTSYTVQQLKTGISIQGPLVPMTSISVSATSQTGASVVRTVTFQPRGSSPPASPGSP